MKQVNVLISTYNGEKYLKEQIDSILAQTYSNIKIYVRDDGSQDGTLKLLDELEKQHPDVITWWAGKNAGFGRSFMEVLKQADEGDYWAFCDQDDVWMPEKIAWAVEWLESQPDKEKPLMFHSAFRNTNEALEPVGDYLPPAYAYNFIRSITDCVHMGFSDVINAPLRDKMLMGNLDVINTHDHWAEILVMGLGRVEFDTRIGSLHRRLDNSVSEGNIKNKIKWLKRTFGGESDILPQARECKRLFAGELAKRDAKKLDWFVFDHYCFTKQMRKLFYPHRWRPGVSSELVMRFLMLTGKV